LVGTVSNLSWSRKGLCYLSFPQRENINSRHIGCKFPRDRNVDRAIGTTFSGGGEPIGRQSVTSSFFVAAARVAMIAVSSEFSAFSPYCHSRLDRGLRFDSSLH
jgi:hypothetical protein